MIPAAPASRRTRRRLVVLQALVLALVATLGGRLAQLQLVEGARYSRTASATSVREVPVPAVRGLVVDARGRPLAANRTTLVVSVDRAALRRQPDGGRAVLARLAGVLGRPADELARRITPCGRGVPRPCWAGAGHAPVPVAVQSDPATQGGAAATGTAAALRVLESRENFPGVLVEPQAVRAYPTPGGANAAHLLGYVTGSGAGGRDTAPAGRSGLERAYDSDLRGADGARRFAVDAAGEVVATLPQTPPVPGSSLVTSIDVQVQAATEAALRAAVARARSQRDRSGQPYRADAAAAVVLDHRTGRIVALASLPTYDPAVWVGGVSEAEYRALTADARGAPLLSRATQGQSAPASTFKVVTTAAAARAGYPLDGQYACPGSYRLGDRTFTNYESRAFGRLTLRRALEVSCDTVFYRLAHQMWAREGGPRLRPGARETLADEARAWGLGRPTGVDLPGEAAGRVVDRAVKQAIWASTRDGACRRARTGHRALARTDPARAAYLTRVDAEHCADGGRFRAGDALNAAIGQGDTLVTPLQLAVAYGAIANGGTLWRPTVGRAVVRPDGRVVREITPSVAGRLPVAPAVLRYLRAALYGTTRAGTGRGPFAGFPLTRHPIATKTGTGEVFGRQPTSWFASFDARYAVVLTVSQGGTGSGTSGPSVRAIYEAVYGIGRPPALPGGLPPAGLPRVAAP